MKKYKGERLEPQITSKEMKRFITKMAIPSIVMPLLAVTVFKSANIALMQRLLEERHNNSIKVYPIEYNVDYLEECVNGNCKLSDNEKNVILDNADVICDYKDTINMQEVYYSLSNLDVEYINSTCSMNGGILGLYYSQSDKIELYNTDEENMTKELFVHEFNHLIADKSLNKQGVCFDEAVTEILTSEYCEDNIKAYLYERYLTYALMELIGKEPLLDLHFKGTLKSIKDSLCDIIDDPAKADRLIELSDNLYDLEYEQCADPYNSDKVNKIIDETVENNNEIYKILGDYYYALYNQDIADDDVMRTYLVSSGFKDYRYSLLEYLEPKGYFNPDYMEEHSKVKIGLKLCGDIIYEQEMSHPDSDVKKLVK